MFEYFSRMIEWAKKNPKTAVGLGLTLAAVGVGVTYKIRNRNTDGGNSGGAGIPLDAYHVPRGKYDPLHEDSFGV